MFGPWSKNFKAFPNPDKYGRWAGGLITGETDSGLGKQRLAAIAVYRPPGHSLAPGCLVARVAVAEMLKTAAQVHQLFYSGLGKLIEDTRRGGPTEFIIQGDFNATVLRGIQTKSGLRTNSSRTGVTSMGSL